VQSAALGAFHSCFVSSGELFCAGLGEQGQLGVSPDTLESCTTPDPAWIEEGDGAGEVACRTSFARVAMNGSVDAVVAGLFSTCARVDGAWRCFGSNRRGELGRGATSDFEWEPGALAFSRGIQQVALGGRQICLLDDEDLVFCAGENGLGELGIGTAPSEECETGLCRLSFGPLSDRQGLQAVVALVGAGCVLDGAGAVACFGGDARGVLGNSKGAPDECSGVPCSRRPVDVYRIVDQLEIDAGDDFVCTRRADQTIHCWGDNEMAQLAQGSPGGYYDIPTQAYGLTP
jgi:alpha-tubulin suppressor-like RCC1 family protein